MDSQPDPEDLGMHLVEPLSMPKGVLVYRKPLVLESRLRMNPWFYSNGQNARGATAMGGRGQAATVDDWMRTVTSYL